MPLALVPFKLHTARPFLGLDTLGEWAYNSDIRTMAQRKGTPVEEYITTTEAAELLGVTARYVAKLVESGTLEGRKVNARLWLVNRASLANWTPKRKRRKREPTN